MFELWKDVKKGTNNNFILKLNLNFIGVYKSHPRVWFNFMNPRDPHIPRSVWEDRDLLNPPNLPETPKPTWNGLLPTTASSHEICTNRFFCDSLTSSFHVFVNCSTAALSWSCSSSQAFHRTVEVGHGTWEFVRTWTWTHVQQKSEWCIPGRMVVYI